MPPPPILHEPAHPRRWHAALLTGWAATLAAGAVLVLPKAVLAQMAAWLGIGNLAPEWLRAALAVVAGLLAALAMLPLARRLFGRRGPAANTAPDLLASPQPEEAAPPAIALPDARPAPDHAAPPPRAAAPLDILAVTAASLPATDGPAEAAPEPPDPAMQARTEVSGKPSLHSEAEPLNLGDFPVLPGTASAGAELTELLDRLERAVKARQAARGDTGFPAVHFGGNGTPEAGRPGRDASAALREALARFDALTP